MNELVIIRAIACLCVVLLHSIKFDVGFQYSGNNSLKTALLIIAGMLSIGTPIFVVISEILLSYSYPRKLPNGFFKKRIYFILFPFITMAVFYAVVISVNDFAKIPINIALNLIGNYHGWFILVVFQFYLLHIIFIKISEKLSPTFILVSSFLINMLYLGYFNYIKPPSNNEAILYLWDRGYWVLFLGWIFYFAIAFYCGKDYDAFKTNLIKYQYLIFAALPFTSFLIIYNSIWGNLGYGSKRIDMVIFTINAMFALFLFAFNIKKTPYVLELISRYSFGIYLAHFFYLIFIDKVFEATGLNFGYFDIVIYFLFGIVSSMLTVKMVNTLPFGKYLIGNLKTQVNPKILKKAA
ncbi:acyltransferase family protein [Peribacillus frigoritolerans]|uniref:acyltransferase family protein n=1 Tax=Peribacillus frigoritolerans TaxID=450367 RepID=UPI003D2E242A